MSLCSRSSCSNGSGMMSAENTNNGGGETTATDNSQVATTDGQVNVEDSTVHAAAGVIDLPLGDALTLSESLHITRAQRTQLVVIAGAVGSGKTTLIATLFHLFQRRDF